MEKEKEGERAQVGSQGNGRGRRYNRFWRIRRGWKLYIRVGRKIEKREDNNDLI